MGAPGASRRSARAGAALDARAAEQLAHDLSAASRSADVSFLAWGTTLFWARGPEDPGSPFSATTTLIQGIHADDPKHALEVLRSRIYSTREADPFAAGMVKLAAKKLSAGVEPRDRGRALPYELCEVRHRLEPARVPPALAAIGDGRERAHEDWLARARAAVRATAEDDGSPLWTRDRRVAALLVSRDGRLLGASANTNARERTRHAELNVLSSFYAERRSRLPAGARLYVTREPCCMCAGLAWLLAAEAGELRVFYATKEPGPAAGNSVLDPRSEARRRFARTEEERRVRCLVHVPLPPREEG